jgi:Ca2+-binding RTX toxin-like protein
MMTTNNVTKYLKFANVQMAAESLFGFRNPATIPVGATVDNTNETALSKENLVFGNNNRASKFTDTLAKEFADNWQLVEHKANTATGFSGTLFKAKQDNAALGIKKDELVLSFRSTEFADDAARDNEATNRLEIQKHGWAFGQIADMENWYAELLTRTDATTGELVLGNSKLNVTGYSLGGHLATAFNLLRQADGTFATRIQETYTFNGAGVGTVKDSGANGLPATLKSVIDEFRVDSANTITNLANSYVRGVYFDFKQALTGSANITEAQVTAARALLNTQIDDDPDMGASGKAAARKEAASLIEALDRVRLVRAEALRAPQLPDAGAGGQAANIDMAKIGAASIDYQLAVGKAALRTSAAKTDPLSSAIAGYTGRLRTSGITGFNDVYGEVPPSSVAHSQYHYGKDVPVFIEDQPLHRGEFFTQAYEEWKRTGDIKLLLPNFSENDFGDTHSLVLLVDSLAVQHTFAQIDPSIDANTLKQVILAASNKKADSIPGQQGKAEGDVLENVVNSLSAMLGEDVVLVGNNNGGTWADVPAREAMHAQLKAIQSNPTFLALQGRVSLQSSDGALKLTPAENGTSVPLALLDFGAYAALKALSPFMLVAKEGQREAANSSWQLLNDEVSAYSKWLADTQLSEAQRNAGFANFSNEWLADRAKMVNALGARNLRNIDEAGSIPLLANEIQGVLRRDLQTNTTIRSGVGLQDFQRRRVTFGTDEADSVSALEGGGLSDALYGQAGDDTLTGNKGDDYLEGGLGNDKYIYVRGDGKDTILDVDGKGELRIGNYLQFRGRRLAARASGVSNTISEVWIDENAGLRFQFTDTARDASNSRRGNLLITRYDGNDLALNPDLMASGSDAIKLRNVGYQDVVLSAPSQNGPNQPGYMGIKLDLDRRVGVAEGVGSNQFARATPTSGGGTPNPINLSELGSSTLNLVTDFVSDVAVTVRVLLTGGLGLVAAKFGLTLGDETVQFGAEGYIDVTLNSGSAQKFVSLHSLGDIDQSTNGTLEIQLLDANGQVATNSDGSQVKANLAVNFTATDEANDLPNVTVTIDGDQLFSGFPDQLDGSRSQARNERLNGLNGNDTLRGFDGDDILDGGQGRNILSGGTGKDVLMNIGTMGPNITALDAIGDGGADDDSIFVGERKTDWAAEIAAGATEVGSTDFGAFIGGGSGNDRILGSANTDVILGGEDRDLIVAGGGADVIMGDAFAISSAGNGFTYAENTAEYSARRGFVVQQQPEGFSNTTIVVEAGSKVSPGSDAVSQLLMHEQATAGKDDTIHAGGGNDYAIGDGGNDTVYGELGNDTLAGGHGNDTLLGGAGNDLLMGDYNLNLTPISNGVGVVLTGDDFVDGGDGDDIAMGNRGNDVVYGGRGDDILYGDEAPDSNGNNGDYTDGAGGDDYIDGEQGNDGLFGGAGNDTLYGGEGDDVLGGDGQVEFAATVGPNAIQRDVSAARGGSDVIDGGVGNDYIFAGGGDDTLFGGDGNDILKGEEGNDYLDGGRGKSLLVGGAGNDTLIAGDDADNNLLRGDDVASILAGSQHGNDTIFGGKRRDFIEGGGGDDTIYGGGDWDEINGDDPNLAESFHGNDTLAGRHGNDTLLGGAGNDVLMGDYNLNRTPISNGIGSGVRYVQFADGVRLDQATQAKASNDPQYDVRCAA